MLSELAIEVQNDLSLCFIDDAKAFDKVLHEELDMLKLDPYGNDIQITYCLSCEQTANRKRF